MTTPAHHRAEAHDPNDDPLYAVLVALTGRRLPMSAVYQAVGLSRQQVRMSSSCRGRRGVGVLRVSA
jgi:hypothetical protein